MVTEVTSDLICFGSLFGEGIARCIPKVQRGGQLNCTGLSIACTLVPVREVKSVAQGKWQTRERRKVRCCGDGESMVTSGVTCTMKRRANRTNKQGWDRSFSTRWRRRHFLDSVRARPLITTVTLLAPHCHARMLPQRVLVFRWGQRGYARRQTT